MFQRILFWIVLLPGSLVTDRKNNLATPGRDENTMCVSSIMHSWERRHLCRVDDRDQTWRQEYGSAVYLPVDSTKFFLEQTFVGPKFFGPKIFLIYIFFREKNLDQKMRSNSYLSKSYWTPFLGSKFILPANFWDPKYFWTHKFFGSKYFWTQKLLDQNIFGPKNFLEQNILGLNI